MTCCTSNVLSSAECRCHAAAPKPTCVQAVSLLHDRGLYIMVSTTPFGTCQKMLSDVQMAAHMLQDYVKVV